MLVYTNKAQYTCYKTLIWVRVSLTCCTCICAGGGEAMMFSFGKSTSLEGGSEKKPREDQGGLPKMKGKNKEIIIAHPLDKLL